MDFKSEKISQNHSSELTYTKRKQSPQNIYSHINQASSNARIFKYPYLDEKQDQYDNVSNKSTEKPKQRAHRRKIFDNRSVGSSVMKMSVLSADRNRNSNPDFQSNPSRSKIKQGNKNRSVSGNNFYQNQRRNVSPTPSVVFHYQSPGFFPSSQNPVSTLKQPIGSLYYRAPQVQVLSYPTQTFQKVDESNSVKQASYIPITSYIPQNHLPSPIQARNEIEYKRKQNPISYDTLSNQTPKITYVIKEKNQLQPSFITQGVPSFNYSLLRNQVHHSQIHSNPQQNIQYFQPQYQRLNEKKVLFQSMEIKNEQSNAVNFAKPIMTNVKIVEQRKSNRKESPEKAQNIDLFKQMVETYKIGHNKVKSEITTNNVIVISNKGSPERLPKPLEASKQKLSTFYPQQQREQRKLSEVEQIDAVFDEIDQYSDRFFDMDFKDNQKLNSDQNRTQKQIFNDKKTVTKLSTSSMDLNQKRGKQLDFEDFSDSQDSGNEKVRNRSSTAVEMRVPKQQNSMTKRDFRKNIQNQIEQKLSKVLRKVDSEGKLLTWFLVGIGFILVILQLIK